LTQIVLELDGAKIAEMLRGPTGPVYRLMIDRSQRVQEASKMQAPIKTGCLRGSIVKRFERTDTGDIAVRIVSDTTPCNPRRASYSLFVHEGTPPHRIEGRPLLAFDWPNGPTGGMFFATFVNHPGTAPNRFLSDNLYLAVT
jgi:hypothetical protein